MPARRRRTAADADWAFHADDDAVLDALRSGAHAASLRVYFGAANLAELAQQAQTARRARTVRAPRILILPGIMGSKLGDRRLVWIDPVAIRSGKLCELALPEGRRLKPQGVLPLAYARLKLELQNQGFDAAFHAYDWRLSLEESGGALAGAIAARGEPVILIGHSMGGLVARMAMARLPKRLVRKLIMLGTPNFGSFAPLQALRGNYPFVRKLATLDLGHSPKFLAAHVFTTFPGLVQLLPNGEPSRWPGRRAAPAPRLLAEVAAIRARLAAPDPRMLQIVGVGRPTIVAAHPRAAGFRYETSLRGDGTVPLARALLPNIRTFYVEEWHALLANHPAVIAAIIDLIRSGRTRALAPRFKIPRGAPQYFDEAAIEAGRDAKIDWLALDQPAREAMLADLNSRDAA